MTLPVYSAPVGKMEFASEHSFRYVYDVAVRARLLLGDRYLHASCHEVAIVYGVLCVAAVNYNKTCHAFATPVADERQDVLNALTYTRLSSQQGVSETHGHSPGYAEGYFSLQYYRAPILIPTLARYYGQVREKDIAAHAYFSPYRYPAAHPTTRFQMAEFAVVPMLRTTESKKFFPWMLRIAQDGPEGIVDFKLASRDKCAARYTEFLWYVEQLRKGRNATPPYWHRTIADHYCCPTADLRGG